MIHRLAERLLPVFGAAQRPAAWVLMVAGAVAFVAVLFNLIATGQAKVGTLLVAADCTISGFAAVQTAELDADDDRAMESP